jgi:hypothetical protein
MTPTVRLLVELLARAVARELAMCATDGEKKNRANRTQGSRGQGDELEHPKPTTKREQFNAR